MRTFLGQKFFVSTPTILWIWKNTRQTCLIRRKRCVCNTLPHTTTNSHNHITHYPSSHHITLTTISFISFTLYSTSRHTITTTIIYYINTIQYHTIQLSKPYPIISQTISIYYSNNHAIRQSLLYHIVLKTISSSTPE